MMPLFSVSCQVDSSFSYRDVYPEQTFRLDAQTTVKLCGIQQVSPCIELRGKSDGGKGCAVSGQGSEVRNMRIAYVPI
jgi:hypothetical protein